MRQANSARYGKWHVVGHLGGGGMGEVFLASGPHNQTAALKVVRPELADDPSFRARFRREVEASSRVRGPFVAELLDADADASRPWIATAYVAGPTLAMQVDQQGPLGEHGVRALAVALAEALASIWDAGIVHRDLKPSNVILAARGPVLIDFGIAAATEATALTAPGTTLGSAGWMAPEHLIGSAEPAPSQDVWGWGALVAFASAGNGPYGRGSADALRWRALNQGVDESVIASVPTNLRSLVARALAVEPQRRPGPSDLPRLVSDAALGTQSVATQSPAEVTQLWHHDATKLLPPPHTTPAARGRSRRSWAVIGAVAAGVMAALAFGVWNWADDSAGTSSADAPSTTTTTPSTSTSSTEVTRTTDSTTTSTVPPSPDLAADLVGTTDTDPTHWHPSDAEPDMSLSVRVFDDGWVHVSEFPVTMNGCETRQLRVAWRSITTPVRSGVSYFTDSWDDTPIAPDQVRDAAQSGTLLLNGCEQPAFSAAPGDGISDITVEVSTFYPAVGSR